MEGAAVGEKKSVAGGGGEGGSCHDSPFFAHKMQFCGQPLFPASLWLQGCGGLSWLEESGRDEARKEEGEKEREREGEKLKRMMMGGTRSEDTGFLARPFRSAVTRQQQGHRRKWRLAAGDVSAAERERERRERQKR